MTLTLTYGVRSHAGRVRANNEDAGYASRQVLAVADGVGGGAAGEVASALAITAMTSLENDVDQELDTALRASVLRANHAIHRAVERDAALEGMATTLTVLRLLGCHLGLVHVGDSRAYLLRDGRLSQVTRDDTLVQALVDNGTLTPAEALTHPQRSVIVRALKGNWVEPAVWIREPCRGDRYLLCTDGLSDMVCADAIGETLRMTSPQECADELIELALRGGGRDNVTVIVADVCSSSDSQVAVCPATAVGASERLPLP
jgi:serine/threonine protein phosphatase PrpC